MDSNKQKFKRFYKTIGIIISLLTVFVVTIFLLLFDPFVYKSTDRNYSNKDIYNDAISNATNNIKDEYEFRYDLSLYINELFHNSYLENKDSFYMKTNNFYYLNENDMHEFVFEISDIFPFNHTRLVIDTKLSSNDEGYVFDIKDIRLGRFNAYRDVVNNKRLTDEFMHKLFLDAGMNIDSDLSNNQFIYTYASKMNDFYSFYKSDDSFFDAYLKQLPISSDSLFTISGDLSNLISNDLYDDVVNKKDININVDNYRYMVGSLLQNKSIDSEHSSLLYKYFLKGYEHLSNDEKTYINKIDLSTFDIFDNSSYKGFDIGFIDDQKISNKISNDLDNIDTSAFISNVSKEVSVIDEALLTKNLESSSNLFHSHVFSSPSSLSTYTFKDVKVEIFDNHLIFVIVINIDGLDTKIYLDYELVGPLISSNSLIFNLCDASFGDTSISDKFLDEIISFFKEALGNISDESLFDFDGNDLLLSVDKAIDLSSKSSFYKSMGEFSFDISGVYASNLGAIHLLFKKY